MAQVVSGHSHYLSGPEAGLNYACHSGPDNLIIDWTPAHAHSGRERWWPIFSAINPGWRWVCACGHVNDAADLECYWCGIERQRWQGGDANG